MKIPLKNLRSERLKHIEHITELLPKGVYLAGGAMRSLLNPKDYPVDFDLFFSGTELRDTFLSYLESLRYTVVFRCPRDELITLIRRKEKIQLITPRFYSSLEDVVDSFDFTASACGTDGEFLYAHDDWAKDNLKKELHMAQLEYPIATIRRVDKYKSYGFKVNDTFWIEFGELLAGRQWSADGMRLYVD